MILRPGPCPAVRRRRPGTQRHRPGRTCPSRVAIVKPAPRCCSCACTTPAVPDAAAPLDQHTAGAVHVRCADLVITICCGTPADLPSTPAAKTLDEVRPIRDDIDARVRSLLADLVATRRSSADRSPGGQPPEPQQEPGDQISTSVNPPRLSRATWQQRPTSSRSMGPTALHARLHAGGGQSQLRGRAFLGEPAQVGELQRPPIVLGDSLEKDRQAAERLLGPRLRRLRCHRFVEASTSIGCGRAAARQWWSMMAVRAIRYIQPSSASSSWRSPAAR